MKPIMNRASGSLARAAALLLLLLVAAVSQPSGQALPDTVEPVVWFASPDDDDTVSGTVTVDVEAYDASGIGGVILEVDGSAVGAEDTSAPWSFAWNADASGAGSHILTAVVRDNAGNAVRSDVVAVVVGSYVPPPPPPPPVNHNPVAVGDSLTSPGRVAVTFTAASLLANDSDPDLQAIAVTSVASTSSGGGTIANLGGGSYRYTPAATFSGVDTFGYSIADVLGATASADVSVTVTAPPPPPPPTGSGLVAAFGFDEASGATAVNSSNAAYNGTILQAARVAGKIGRGLSFDGVNDWVTVNDITASPLDLATGMTVEAWVNPTAMSGWETVVLKERGAAGTGLLSYALYAHDGAPTGGGFAGPAGYLRPNPANSTTDQGVRQASHTAIPLNAWTHIATTYDGANQRLYINGALVATKAQTGSIAVGNQPLRIGGNSVSGEFFRGVIDEVRIYNRALTAAEITADMAAPVR